MKRPDSGNLTGMRFRAELLFYFKKLMNRLMICIVIPSLEFRRIKETLDLPALPD
jgi:hypothetical protein